MKIDEETLAAIRAQIIKEVLPVITQQVKADLEATKVDDTKTTVHTFLDQISQAQMNNKEWVETTEDIIRHYNRKGLGGKKYFIFQGIKVCAQGQREGIEREMNTQLQTVLHPGDLPMEGRE